MSPGDIALVHFPFSVAAGQAGEFKKRPVLVVSTPQDGEETLVFAMITGNARRFARPRVGDIRLDAWERYGLAGPSTVRTRRIWTGETRDVARTIGAVDAPILTAVVDEITNYIGAARPAQG